MAPAAAPAALLAGFISFGGQPGLDVSGLCLRVEEPHGEQPLGSRLVAMRGQQARRRVELAQPGNDGEEHVLAFAPNHQVDLGEYDAISHRHLLHGLGMGIERCHAVEGIDDSDDPFQPARREQPRLAHHRVQHRCGIGKPCRLDDDTVEGLDLAAATSRKKIMDRVDEVTTDGAAQAARRHLDNVLIRPLDQQVIDADVSEFVDDDGGIRQKRVLQKEVEKRGLSGPEEAGEDRDGNGSIGHELFLPLAEEA